MRLPLIILLLIQSLVDACSDVSAVEVTHLDLEIELQLTETENNNSLSGKAVFSFKPSDDNPPTSMSFLLNRFLKVDEVWVNGDPVATYSSSLKALENFERFQVLHTKINLPTKETKDTPLRITIVYSGSLASYQETGMEYVRETLSPQFTMIRNESLSFPTLAFPNAESLFGAWRSQVFDSEIKVIVPRDYTVATGHPFKQITQDKTKVFQITMKDKEYGQIILPIAKYKAHHTGPITIYSLDKDRDSGQQLSLVAKDGVALLEKWLGPRKDGQLAIISIPPKFGSQAIFPTVIQEQADGGALFDRHELYHELAHLWQPKSTDKTPSRWKEGLSNMMAALMVSFAEDSVFYENYIKQRIERAKKELKNHSSHSRSSIVEFGQDSLAGYSYLYTTIFFADLYKELGSDNFYKLVSDLNVNFAETGVTDKEFKQFLETFLLAQKKMKTYNIWLANNMWAENILARSL